MATKTCIECSQPFRLRIKIEGKWVNLQHRSRCLSCLPFKSGRGKNPEVEPKESSVCSGCSQVKKTEDFYTRSKTGHPSSWCKTCYKQRYQRAYDKAKKQAIADLGGRCQSCLRSFPDVVYDFHHTDPTTKLYTWREMRQMRKAERNEELKKCVLLCSNCHRIRHGTEHSDDIIQLLQA